MKLELCIISSYVRSTGYGPVFFFFSGTEKLAGSTSIITNPSLHLPYSTLGPAMTLKQNKDKKLRPPTLIFVGMR